MKINYVAFIKLFYNLMIYLYWKYCFMNKLKYKFQLISAYICNCDNVWSVLHLVYLID